MAEGPETFSLDPGNVLAMAFRLSRDGEDPETGLAKAQLCLAWTEAPGYDPGTSGGPHEFWQAVVGVLEGVVGRFKAARSVE